MIPDELRKFIESEKLEIVDLTITIGYDKLAAHEILKSILPSNIECPKSFETVDHIIHFNLRDELLPYKEIIGKIYLT
eukprot:UN28755